MRSLFIKTVFLLLCQQMVTAQTQRQKDLSFFAADHPLIQYTGRIDFSNPKFPRFWQPGVHIDLSFEGNDCAIVLNDEVLWGTKHNYIEIVLDGKAKRIQTTKKNDTLFVAQNAGAGNHVLQLVKNTEANIGYLDFGGVYCKKLLESAPKPVHKIEFIGNSITCGTGSDVSAIPCGAGVWEDQHNAYLSYGAITAHNLQAQYHLSSVSGIGLMHSCCNMNIIMPQVYDKTSMRNDTIAWNFNNYQPDIITICLGQNDGVQDSTLFCSNYISFLKQVRDANPNATVICLSSPMADEHLVAFMKRMITSIVETLGKEGFQKLSYYFFSRRYHHGCDSHPNLEEHQQIANELTGHIKKLTNW